MPLTRRTALSLLAVSASTIALPAAMADTPSPSAPARPDAADLRRALTPEDLRINKDCIRKTLTEAPTGTAWDWKNPKSGNHGIVTPTSKHEGIAGRVCRSFRETITLKDSRSQTINGRACQNRDGSWDMIG